MKVYKDKYIVLTGGAGFIGSAVLKILNDQGINNIVVVDDLLDDERWKNLVSKRFLEILHKDDLFTWLKGRASEIEAFIHLGACSSTIERDANYLLENNYRYSTHLAEFALEHDHRFIYASSAATYGSGDRGFSDDHSLLESYEPLNMYGYSKHLFDLWLKDHGLLDQVVGLKYFNVYGPNELHKGRMCSAIVKMVHDIQREGGVKLFQSSEPEKYKDGEQVRDFIYVKDAAAMTVQFLEKDVFGIYNIGSGQPRQWRDLAAASFNALGVSGSINYIPMPEDLCGKYQNYTCADMGKSQANGLEIPRFSLEEGVKDYIHNYLVPRKHW